MRTLVRVLFVWFVATLLHSLLDILFGFPSNWVRSILVSLAVTPVYIFWVFSKPEPPRG